MHSTHGWLEDPSTYILYIHAVYAVAPMVGRGGGNGV